MREPELEQLRERIHAVQSELDRQMRDTQFIETNEANLQLFARSLAHDFNNLLTGILGHAALIQTSPDAGEESREAAAVIYKAAERAADLVRQLRHFTRGALTLPQPVDLHATIREVAGLLKRGLEPSLNLVLSLEAVEYHVNGDAGQIHQMLLNLALNARDAMPDGGTLSVETANQSCTPGGPGPAVVVTVRDTGVGIPPSQLESIFEPFFTTKAPGSGSGMGLSIVDRVVRNHQGKITLETGLGIGSAFSVCLPVCREATSARNS
jgi:signal transduction histidine kinase